MEHYCAYQDRCHFDVEKKLRDYFIIPEAKDEILLSLMQDNFLNEERFAKSFVRGKFKTKKWGKIKIKHELKHKNISEYLINAGLKEIDDEEYFDVAKSLTQAKLDNTTAKNSYELKSKVINYMQRKGFEYNLVLEITDELIENNY